MTTTRTSDPIIPCISCGRETIYDDDALDVSCGARNAWSCDVACLEGASPECADEVRAWYARHADIY